MKAVELGEGLLEVEEKDLPINTIVESGEIRVAHIHGRYNELPEGAQEYLQRYIKAGCTYNELGVVLESYVSTHFGFNVRGKYGIREKYIDFNQRSRENPWDFTMNVFKGNFPPEFIYLFDLIDLPLYERHLGFLNASRVEGNRYRLHTQITIPETGRVSKKHDIKGMVRCFRRYPWGQHEVIEADEKLLAVVQANIID